MLMKPGYRHVYVSRSFATKHHLVDANVRTYCPDLVGDFRPADIPRSMLWANPATLA